MLFRGKPQRLALLSFDSLPYMDFMFLYRVSQKGPGFDQQQNNSFFLIFKISFVLDR